MSNGEIGPAPVDDPKALGIWLAARFQAVQTALDNLPCADSKSCPQDGRNWRWMLPWIFAALGIGSSVGVGGKAVVDEYAMPRRARRTVEQPSAPLRGDR